MGYVHNMEYAESYLTCRYYPNRGKSKYALPHFFTKGQENPAEKETR